MGTNEWEGRDENVAVRRPSRLRKDILDYKYHASRTPESTFEISTISRIWSIRYFSSPPEPDDYVTSSASVPSNRPSERQQSGTKICDRIKVGCGFF